MRYLFSLEPGARGGGGFMWIGGRGMGALVAALALALALVVGGGEASGATGGGFMVGGSVVGGGGFMWQSGGLHSPPVAGVFWHALAAIAVTTTNAARGVLRLFMARGYQEATGNVASFRLR